MKDITKLKLQAPTGYSFVTEQEVIPDGSYYRLDSLTPDSKGSYEHHLQNKQLPVSTFIEATDERLLDDCKWLAETNRLLKAT